MKRVCSFFIIAILIANLLPTTTYAELLDVSINKEIVANKVHGDVLDKLNEDEKVMVAIWYNDVNQQTIEFEVEEKIGFNKNELVNSLPSISEEDVSKIYDISSGKSTDSSEKILEEYLSETEYVRNREKETTKKYIACRRSVLKDKIAEKTKEIINETNIRDSVKFESNYAPMIIAELTFQEINEVAKNINVKDICYFDEGVEAIAPTYLSLDSFNDSTNISSIHSEIGLSGEGVKVGIIENTNFVRTENLPESRCFYLGNTDLGNHATNTALILSGNEGVAPNSKLYSINIDENHLDKYPDSWGNAANKRRFFKCVEDLISENVDVINSSFGWATTSGYDLLDKWVDYVVENTNTIFVASGGNNKDNNPIILSPAKGWNVITVGGCDNKGTVITTDDTMYDFSYDDAGGVQKPDIVAPCNVSGGYPSLNYGGGTSSAAPLVSGTIALMLELRPFLAAYPEAVKAILMASCHYKALPIDGDSQETMSSGLTEKQGAGVFNPYLAICITAQGNYYIGELSSGSTYDSSLFYQPKNSATGMNLSLAWLKTNNAEETENDYSVTEGINKNLKLSLYKNSSTITVANSDNNNSSTEMLYYTNLSNGTVKYQVTVSPSSTGAYSTSTRFAYAWSLNNEIYQKVEQYEGLYYIKNADNGKYLTYDSINDTYKLNQLSSNNNQIFVIKVDSLYKILNGYVVDGGITYKEGELSSSSSPSNIGISNAGRGKLYIYTASSGIYALNASSTTLVNWELYANANSKKWVIEKITYRLGDVNKDGVIDSSDANIILQYSSKSIDLYNNEKFLADINNDSVINNQDALEVLKIASKL